MVKKRSTVLFEGRRYVEGSVPHRQAVAESERRQDEILAAGAARAKPYAERQAEGLARIAAAGAARPFVAGDVVRLKSGGMLMTVTSNGCGDNVDVTWSGYSELKEDTILGVCLQLIDPDDARLITRHRMEDPIPF